MKAYELQISGMSCNHCVMHVTNALQVIDGVEVENVEIGKARVWFDDDKLKKDVAEKIEEAGYKLVSIE